MRRLSAASVYIIMQSVVTFANALIFTVSSVYYVTKVGLDPLQLVLVGTVLEGTIFLCEVPTGVVADTYSRRMSVIIGIFLTGVAFGMQGLASEYWIILLAQVVWGVGATFISGAETAWIADEVGDEQLGALMVRSGQFGRVASLLGILASVGLASLMLSLPILLSGVLYLLVGGFAVMAMPEQGFAPTPRGERNSWQSMGQTFTGGVKVIRGRPILWTILAVGFFMGAASEGYDRLRDAHLLHNFSFPDVGGFSPVVWFGIIGIGDQILGFLIVLTLQRRIEARMTNPTAIARLLLITQGLQIVVIIVLGLAGWFWLALAALWSKDIVSSIMYPLYTTWLTQHIPSKVRATVLSMNSQTDAIGQIAGGPGVGAIGSAFSTRAAIVVAGVLLSPALVLYARLIRANRPSVAEAELEVAEVG